VFGSSANPAQNGGIQDVIAYSAGIALANGGDRIELAVGGTMLDSVVWATGWPGSMDGTAMCLKPPYGDNALQASWGRSVGTFGSTGDRGSPGFESTATNCQ